MTIIDPLSIREPDIRPVSPDEVFVICGHFVSLPQYTIDRFYTVRGVVFVEVSSARASVFDPPDATIFRADITSDGSVMLTEVAWNNGALS